MQEKLTRGVEGDLLEVLGNDRTGAEEQEGGRRVLDICTDRGTPALADRAQARPPWEADLEGEKVVNETLSQLLVGTVQTTLLQEKGSIGKELGSEKETWGNEK